MRWVALLLTAVLLLSIAPMSFAAKKGQGSVYGLEGRLFTWLYATDTIPEGVGLIEASDSINMYQGSRMGNEPEYEDEHVFDIQISFVSGDERLKDAVIIDKNEESQSMTVRIDNNVIRQPGEAILHFVCEGENLRAEFDRTIRVVDYSEYPAFTAVQEKAEYTFYPGDKLEPAKVAGMALTENIHSIAGTLPQNDCDYYPFYSLGYWDFNPSLSYDDQAFSGMFDVKYEQSEYNYKEWYEAARSGSCTVSAIGTFNNVMVAVPVTLNVLGYSLNGPEMIKPGETAEYTINQADNTARTFTYTVEGEGATFADGKLTAGSEAGTVTLIATPDTGEPAAKKQIMIADGVLGVYQTTQTSLWGYVFNRITDDAAGFRYGKLQNRYGYGASYYDPETGNIRLNITYIIYTSGSFRENPEDALAYYNSEKFQSIYSEGTISAQGDLEFDGHPARYMLMTYPMSDGTTASVGVLAYARNDDYLLFTVQSYVDNPGETPAPVTLSDLNIVSAGLTYDDSALEITQADGTITINCKEGAQAVTAGKKLNFSAVFSKPEITYNTDLNAISWSVVDAETGEPSADVTITDKGVLTAGKNISSILKVKVVAVSDMFHSRSEYDLTVMPVIKKVILEPAEIFLYEGSDAEVTVTAKLDPDITPIGLTWTTKKEGVVEAKVNEDGTAVFKAVAAGKIQYTVKEPGGKTATLKVNVVPPVTALTLSYKGKASPGKTVTITPIFEPKKPGNSAVEWSVNVGEDVATISNKGALKISKDAAPGTVITVTCKALGAPEPVVMTIDVPVE